MADVLSLLWNLVLENKFGTLAQVLVKTTLQSLTEDLKQALMSCRCELTVTHLMLLCFCCVPADAPNSDQGSSGV